MTRIGLMVPVRALALLLAIAASGVFLNSDTALAHNFDACASGAPVDTTPGAASDITGKFGVGIGPDCAGGTADDVISYNSGGLVTVTPPEWIVAASTDLPTGTQVGEFSSVAQLGLVNNPCNNKLPVNFDLLLASTDTSTTISAKTPNPDGSQQPNRLDPLAQDSDSNGIPDGADRWPDFLTTQGQKQGWDLSKLKARLVGFNTGSVPGLTVVLNFLVFEPGSPITPLFNIDPRLGYPSVTVLNDPTVAASPKDSVNDFCAPLSTSYKLFGEAGGETFRKNPADGTYNFVTIVASQPDYDEDGIENSLDPCWETPDPDWDPRAGAPIGPGDQDGDGVPDSCDPNPTVKSDDKGGECTAGVGVAGADEDCDKWMNRGDNCPLVSNPDQKDSEPDGIGDACDPDPTARSGHFHLECKVTQVVIGAGGDPATDPQNLQPCNPDAPLPTDDAAATGTPTPVGQTPAPTSSEGGGTGVPENGIGSLSPVGDGAPAWAALITTLGAIGVLGGAGLAASRIARRRD